MSFSGTKAKRAALAYAFLFPTLLLLGIFHIYPMFHAFALSLFDYSLLRGRSEFVGIDNFKELIGDEVFREAFINTLLYLIVVPIIIALSLGLAMLVEPQIPGMNFFRAAYYVPVVTMMVVVAYVWALIFDTDNGLLNQMLIGSGVIASGIPWLTDRSMALWTVMSVTIWKGLGYYMVIFIVGLRTIPHQMIEAARIDGANPIQIFWNVKFPLLWPTVSLVAIISSINALKVFEEIYMMTRGRIGTSTLVYQIYETGFDMQAGSGDLGYASAMGVVLFIMILIFSVFSIRRMEKMFTT